MGLLTGKFKKDTRIKDQNDVRVEVPEWMKYFQQGGRPHPDWLRKFESIKNILTQDGRTVVQGAIAWNWARSRKTIPIPGFRNTEQVDENVKALDFGPLKEEQMKAIDNILGSRLAHF